MHKAKTLTSTLALALFATTASAAETAKPAAPPAKAAEAPKAGAAKAAPVAKGDPTGTWSWTFTTPNGQTMDRTVKLARQGDKLTGSTTGRNGEEIAIQDGAFKDGQASWSIVRERDGQKMVSKVQAKLDGDSLKGTMAFSRNGEEQSRPFEAKRVK